MNDRAIYHVCEIAGILYLEGRSETNIDADRTLTIDGQWAHTTQAKQMDEIATNIIIDTRKRC